MEARFCPNCGSEDVYLDTGGITGLWSCKACGNTGIFPVKDDE